MSNEVKERILSNLIELSKEFRKLPRDIQKAELRTKLKRNEKKRLVIEE